MTATKYSFETEMVSFMKTMFPKTTKLTVCEDSESEVTLCSDIIVNCEDNFTEDEKQVIDRFDICNVEHLVRHEQISKHDKQRGLKCYQYVRERYGTTGVEPFNGHCMIQMDSYAFNVRILPSGQIKYCRSFGKRNVQTDFVTIGYN